MNSGQTMSTKMSYLNVLPLRTAAEFQMELGADAPRRREGQAVGVGCRAREDGERAHPARGKERAGGERRVLRVEQDLVPDREAHVPAVRVARRLAPVLLLLQKRRDLSRDAGPPAPDVAHHC